MRLIVARVLVSDDDPQILRLVETLLESAGHDVFATSEPREVVEMARAYRPDAIVLDVLMPVSGYELLGVLRREPLTAKVPILFLSGLGEGEDRVRGLSEGADDYLVKPFEPAELLLRIERLIAWRRQPTKESSSSASISPAPAGGSPERYGRYEVIEVIGEGSMGTVYRARDPRLERDVALKTIRLEAANTEQRRQELLDLLRHEAVTIAKLSHPNIIAVYDMGESLDSAYVAMELVEGVSLADLLRDQGPLPYDQLIPLAAAISRGLALTHARQVIHRDVKPGNVLLGREGAIKVSDFGLAFAVSTLLEDSTELSGTPGYVPPEVLNMRAYTVHGDLYGLGATLYEGLAGFHPLAGATLRDTILNTLSGEIRPLRESVPEVSEEIDQLITSLLSLDPEARPSASAVGDQLERMSVERRLRWQPSTLDTLRQPAI